MVVIGGGLAGISAALVAADAGAEVTLIERRRRLGGRTWSFVHNGLRMDNGQHVFMRCCTAYRAFLERIGAGELVELQARLDVPVVAPGGRCAHIRRTAAPAPLHLAGSLIRYPYLGAMERLRLVRAASALARLDPDDPRLDGITFGGWLSQHGQSPRAIEAMWDLIARPTLNLPAGQAALGLAVRVFRTGLLDERSSGDLGWARVPLGELHGEQAERALASADVEIAGQTEVAALEDSGSSWTVVSSNGERRTADSVVVAVAHTRAAALLPPDALGPGRVAQIDTLGTSPIVNVHLVYDRRITDLAFAAAVDSPVQFVFDRTKSSGLRGAGQYLAISLSAADDLLARPSSELVATMHAAMAELFPAATRATVVDSVVTREPTATFRASTNTRRLRPPCRTALPGLFVAGAWTDTGWPDTMEGAVRSGIGASRAALALPQVSTASKEGVAS
jgi:squalene-associated FAD-dependent desaturase